MKVQESWTIRAAWLVEASSGQTAFLAMRGSTILTTAKGSAIYLSLNRQRPWPSLLPLQPHTLFPLFAQSIWTECVQHRELREIMINLGNTVTSCSPDSQEARATLQQCWGLKDLMNHHGSDQMDRKCVRSNGFKTPVCCHAIFLTCSTVVAHSHIVFQQLSLILSKLFISEMLTVFKSRCHFSAFKRGFDRISSLKGVKTVRGVRSYWHWKSEDGEVWSQLFWRSISLRAPSRHLWNSFNQTRVCISTSPWMCTD